jgi:ubiquinone biosynthesis protein COQ4
MTHKIDYRTAYKVAKKLLKNPENTIFIFQFLHATNPPSLIWAYNKLLSTDHGGEIAYNSEEVSEYFDTLADRPENSVGKECHSLFPNQQILLKISRRKSNDKWIEAKHPYSWMSRRYRDTHDTWHTLTGYKAKIVGEMCLAMFSYTQTKSLGWLLIALIVFIYRGMKLSDIKLLREAYANGKNANFLLAENYDKLLNEDLNHARVRLNILPPKEYYASTED